MKKPIETPMYFSHGFIEGTSKRFPEVSGDIANAKRRTSEFMKTTGNKIQNVEKVRKANYQDPTQTDEAKAVNTWRHAEAKHREVQEIAKTLPDLNKYVDGIKKNINNELKQTADTNFGRETRQRMADMSKADRAKFISELMSNGDYETPAYALGAPPHLSGLAPETHSSLRERYVKDFYPREMDLVKSLSELQQNTQKGLHEYGRIMDKLKASASVNGALEKSEKARTLMK